MYNCINCDIVTNNKKDYAKHLLTAKHKKKELSNETATSISHHIIRCDCGKQYKDRTGLWRHQKKCIFPNIIESTKENTIESVIPAFDMNLVLELLKQNQEFKDLIIDQNEHILKISNQQQSQHIEQNKNII